jgi:hypothetical protein
MTWIELTMVLGGLAIVFGFFAFCILINVYVRMKRHSGGGLVPGKCGSATADLNEKESRDFQEVARGLEEMAKRIESLETLLLEKSR